MPAHFIQQIEQHWEQIAAAAIREVKSDPDARYYQALAESELRDRARDIARNLGAWLTLRDRDQLRARYEELAASRQAEGIPPEEVVRKFQMIKRALLGFLRDHRPNLAEPAVERELTDSIHYFFDEAIFVIVRTYADGSS